MNPGQYNFDLLAQIYGTIGSRRMLRKGSKESVVITEELLLPSHMTPTSTENNIKDDTETPKSVKEQVKDDEEPKELPKNVQRLYSDFVTALETISCDEWNESQPEKHQATPVKSNERVEVCALEVGDYVVQVRKLLYFEGWEQSKVGTDEKEDEQVDEDRKQKKRKGKV